MKFKIIEKYNTREEACLKARELNGIRESDQFQTIGKYNYGVVRHSVKGKRYFLVVKPQEVEEEPFPRNKGNYHESKLQKQQREYRQKHIAEIMKMAKNGVPYCEIAKKYNVTSATIGLWVYKVRQGIYTT